MNKPVNLARLPESAEILLRLSACLFDERKICRQVWQVTKLPPEGSWPQQPLSVPCVPSKVRGALPSCSMLMQSRCKPTYLLIKFVQFVQRAGKPGFN